MSSGQIKLSLFICIVCTLIAGFLGLIAGIAISIGAWWYSLQRGKLAVQAYVFLQELNTGATVAEANEKARRIDLYAATELAPEAHMHNTINGGQLATISDARRAGFKV